MQRGSALTLRAFQMESHRPGCVFICSVSNSKGGVGGLADKHSRGLSGSVGSAGVLAEERRQMCGGV